MKPSEVAEIIASLREAAASLAEVRADLGELAVTPSSVATHNGRCKQRILKGVIAAEVALREALAPVGEFEV